MTPGSFNDPVLFDERLPIVPATRGLRKNLGRPSSRMPARSAHRLGASYDT